MLDSGKENILREIVVEYEDENAIVQFSKLNKCIRTYSLTIDEFTQNLKISDIVNTDLTILKVFYLAWFGKNKGYPLGKLISEKFGIDEIPNIYKTVITKAKELVTNG